MTLQSFLPSLVYREFQLPLLHLPSTSFSQQLLKVELSSKSENICKCLKPFRERAGIVRIWHFPSSCKAEGREPWVSPGYPQKSGFFQGSWTSFSGFGHLAHPSLRAILGGFRDPQKYGIPGPPREPGVKNNGLSRPLLGILPRPT